MASLTIGSNSIYTSSTNTSYYSTQIKHIYTLFGVEFEDSGLNQMLPIYITMLNLHGIPFYNDIKKQGISFSNEMEDIITPHRLSWDRNNKIDSII